MTSRRPALTVLDCLLFWSTMPLTFGSLVALGIGQRWSLVALATCTVGASVSILQSRYRRRTALAMRAASPGDPEVARVAATIHLQELGLLLLAVALLFAGTGIFAALG